MKMGNFTLVKKQIEKLDCKKEFFYDNVKTLVGFYDDVFWEDWQIKELQRVADARYSEL